MNRAMTALRAIMSGSAALVVSASVIALVPAGTAVAAEQQIDTQPPSVPNPVTIELDPCGIYPNVGGPSSTDNVTPQSKMRYELYHDGQLLDTGGAELMYELDPSVYRFPVGRTTGTYTVRAVDEAGNRSAHSPAAISML